MANTLKKIKLVAALAILASSSPASDFSEKVSAAVQPMLDLVAAKYNTSLQFGYVDAGGVTGAASGIDNVWNARKLTPDTPVPLGSVTKPWTAVRVLQEVEKGKVSLQDTAKRWVDPVLTRLYNFTLEKLFGPTSDEVKIVDLLGHTSGWGDYNDEALKMYSIENDADDVDPFFYLLSASKSPIACPPQQCSSYSGANYVLLGFVMVEVLELYTWHEFDQKTAIPRSLWEKGSYRHTLFPKLGRCLQYPGVAHSYAVLPPSGNETRSTITDLGYNSCLNGWTMGNVASTASNMAQFFYDLVTEAPTGKGFVNATTLDLMMQYKPMVNQWCTGPQGPGSCEYGLGLEHNQIALDYWSPFFANPTDAATRADEARLIGHDGADWGSMASPCGYNPKFGFGICLVHGSSSGLNCSMSMGANGLFAIEAMCRVYDAVLGVVGGPRFKCDIPTPTDPSNGCVWRKVSGHVPRHGRESISKAAAVFSRSRAQIIV